MTVSHGSQVVLRDFNLVIAEGEHSLLLGPSGSGKSTLINLICGFLSPNAGTILVAGQPISHVGEARRDSIRRDCIGVVFQSLRLVSALDVLGNVMLAARLAGRSVLQAQALDVLDRLGIGNKARMLPRNLSQGEAQRAAIARALISRPRLLIADEPTSALDERHTTIVADLLMELADAYDVTLLVATHDTRLRQRFDRTIDLSPAAGRTQ